MTAETFTVYLADGRQVEVLAAGPEAGLPLVMHNGTPAGLVAYQAMIEAAAARGLSLIMCARPGYGDSTPRPGRRVADVTGDVQPSSTSSAHRTS
jgi:pimeloyl-ACP methyl ester carboxylesterase